MRTAITKTEEKSLSNRSEVSIIGVRNNDSYHQLLKGYQRTDVSLNKYFEIEELRTKFHFDSVNLDNFLLENFNIINFLNSAHKKLSKLFPNGVFVLEVTEDFEVENWKTLYLNVINNIGDPEFNNKLEDFIQNWLFEQDSGIKSLVTIKEMC
jgi:hypothetical protein